tara:strand:+ start:44 stop:673 length:630 start_codon:yes stop_codon:yes gene_type:complete
MKKLFLILLLPLLGFSQQTSKAPYGDREWFKFKQSDLTLTSIEQPEDWVIESTDYKIVVHGSVTILLRQGIDSITKRSLMEYVHWDIPFIYSMYHFHNDRQEILVSEYYSEEENCECDGQLLEQIFSDDYVLYGDITLGDMLKSERLKEYGVVFYNSKKTTDSSEIYQHELVVYYKAKFNPLIKLQRKTRKLTYMIPFQEVVINEEQKD